MIETDLRNMSIDEKVNLAKITTDNKLLNILSNDISTKVRRIVARNKNLSKDTLDRLLYDPVMNVSYIASLNPMIVNHRSFISQIDHPCIQCEDEKNIDCKYCEELLKY